MSGSVFFFFFQAEDGIRDKLVTGVQTCALPISAPPPRRGGPRGRPDPGTPGTPRRARALPLHNHPIGVLRRGRGRSEEHTSELQSLAYLVCRLLLEKKKTQKSKQLDC